MPTPGKPGYVDECLECLIGKSLLLLPKPPKRQSKRPHKSKLQRLFEKAGYSEDRARAEALDLETTDWSSLAADPPSKQH